MLMTENVIQHVCHSGILLQSQSHTGYTGASLVTLSIVKSTAADSDLLYVRLTSVI